MNSMADAELALGGPPLPFLHLFFLENRKKCSNMGRCPDLFYLWVEFLI